MTESQELQHDSSINSKRLLTIILGFGIGAIGIWGFVHMQAAKKTSENALAQALADNTELQTQMANLHATVADIKTANLYQQEEQALAKDDISLVLDRTESIRQILDNLADSQAKWRDEINQLNDNQIGKRLAANPEFVDLLAVVMQTAPSENLANELDARLSPLATQLKNALTEQTVSFKPTEAFIDRIDAIAESAEKAQQWYTDHLLELDALRDQASELDPADRTLRAAVLAREAERAQGRVEVLAERNREAQRKADEMVGAAEAEAERIIAEAEAKAKTMVGRATADRILQEAEEEKSRQEEELRRRQDTERLAQLRREYERDLPDIKIKLHPFIGNGFTYNADSLEAAPVSLSVLRGQGALSSDRKGIERLLYIGGTNTNDRERGSFPQFMGGESGWRALDKEFMATAQEYLKKYGELMVEDGLLAK